MYEFIVRFDGKYVACALQCFVPTNRGILWKNHRTRSLINSYLKCTESGLEASYHIHQHWTIIQWILPCHQRFVFYSLNNVSQLSVLFILNTFYRKFSSLDDMHASQEDWMFHQHLQLQNVNWNLITGNDHSPRSCKKYYRATIIRAYR